MCVQIISASVISLSQSYDYNLCLFVVENMEKINKNIQLILSSYGGQG